MENVDFINNTWTTQKLIPSNKEELTFLWGRKVIENYLNGYGIIGTINATTPSYAVTLNLRLTRLFQNPPHVYPYLVDPSTNKLWLGYSVTYAVIGDAVAFNFLYKGLYVFRVTGA